MARSLHLDCVGGISGDMFLSAASALLPDLSPWMEILRRIPLQGWSIDFTPRAECGIQARLLDIRFAQGTGKPSSPKAVRETIQQAKLPDAVEKDALAMLRLLAEAEGRVHACPPDDVHFHELAGFDLIFDLVGTAALVHLIAPDEITASPLPMGKGTVRMAHGEMPVPPPATLELIKGFPVVAREIEGETVTPTGAAIVKHYVKRFVPFGEGTLLAFGVGAGMRHNHEVPNLLRALLFETSAHLTGRVIVLETNIDDMNPQHFDLLMERLFAAGALDVWLTPILMKKGRPAQMVSVMGRPDQGEKLRGVLFANSRTIGVRWYEAARETLERREEVRETAYGPVRGKVIGFPGGARWVPEYDEVKRIALERGLSPEAVVRELNQI